MSVDEINYDLINYTIGLTTLDHKRQQKKVGHLSRDFRVLENYSLRKNYHFTLVQ